MPPTITIRVKYLSVPPDGEQHNLACGIIESILLSKGYKVYNASPSLPAESVINSLSDILPDAVLISITLMDHLQTAKRLIRKIRTKFSDMPIFVGGIALNDADKTSDFEAINATIIKNMGLTDAIKLVKSTMLPIHAL